MKSKQKGLRKLAALGVLTVMILTQISCQLTSKAQQFVTEISQQVATQINAQTGALPQISGDEYINEEYGFSVIIPEGIEATTSEDGSTYFQDYVLGDSEGFGWSFPTTLEKDDTLEEAAKDIYLSESSWLEDLEILEDGAVSLGDSGLEAWSTRLSGYDRENDYTAEIRLTTLMHSNHTITFEFLSLPENFTFWEDALKDMYDSISLFAPSIEGTPRDQILILEGGETGNPQENDPATTHGSGDTLVFEGLVTYDENLEIAPALAKSWDVNNDGTVYTFHLQPDAVFHDGKPVTASDVVYSWERAADPATASDTVLTYLGDIIGVKEMRDGKAETISGLKILDDHTLQVSIDAAKPYFLYKLIYPTANVLDRENVESDPEWFRSPNGTGPYQLETWISMERKVYTRFEEYYGNKPAIPVILFRLYSGDEFRLYEAGAVDIANVYAYNVERLSDPSEPLHDEMVSGVSMCTTYIQFDVEQPPFDDVKVRQAFNMAIDKQKYLDVALQNTAVMAKGLYPPAMPGFSLDLEGYPYDPEAARQLIRESSYKSVEALPEIVITSSGYGSYSNSLITALSDMWQKNLGVSIVVENIDPEVFYDQRVAEDYGQLTSSGWCADYPDPQNFADVLFHSEAAMNKGHYDNPQLDALLERARVEKDPQERILLYQQAEQMIVEDAPAVFLYHSVAYQVVKPYIKGYILSPISTFPTLRFVSLDEDYWK